MWVRSMMAAVAGFAGFWVAVRLGPTWVADLGWAATAVGIAAALGWRVRGLGPAAGWVTGCLAAAWGLGWALVPNRADFEPVGPVFALWLTAGTLTLAILGRRGAPTGFRGVPARVLVGWALGYGVLWCAVPLLLLAPVQTLDSERLVLGVLMVLAGASALAAAVAFAGPSEPWPQAVALLPAQLGYTVALPDVAHALPDLLARLVQDPWTARPEMLALPAVAASASVVGAVAIWLRARHLARRLPPDAGNSI